MAALAIVIPARAGSVRLPGKNTRLFCGLPLVVRAIRSARELGRWCEAETRVIVTSNDPTVLQMATGERVETIHRREELCGPSAGCGIALVDAVARAGLDDGHVVLWQATSPLRDLVACKRAVEMLSHGSMYVMTGYGDIPYTPDGSFYGFQARDVWKFGAGVFSLAPDVILQPEHCRADIDTLADFVRAEERAAHEEYAWLQG